MRCLVLVDECHVEAGGGEYHYIISFLYNYIIIMIYAVPGCSRRASCGSRGGEYYYIILYYNDIIIQLYHQICGAWL